jgi:hypothetical protein
MPKSELCTCGSPYINGKCLVCGEKQPVKISPDISKFKQLVEKFHQAIVWGNRQVRSGKTLSEETINNYFEKVEDPLEKEYQNLLNQGVGHKTLWKITDKLNLWE